MSTSLSASQLEIKNNLIADIKSKNQVLPDELISTESPSIIRKWGNYFLGFKWLVILRIKNNVY